MLTYSSSSIGSPVSAIRGREEEVEGTVDSREAASALSVSSRASRVAISLQIEDNDMPMKSLAMSTNWN